MRRSELIDGSDCAALDLTQRAHGQVDLARELRERQAAPQALAADALADACRIGNSFFVRDDGRRVWDHHGVTGHRGSSRTSNATDRIWVMASKMWCPPTRPRPDALPAQPPNGRCSSQ